VTLTFDLLTQKIEFFPFHRSITWQRLVNIGRKEALMIHVLSGNQLLTLGHGELDFDLYMGHSDLDLYMGHGDLVFDPPV
jgi:hypothetical protein